MQARYKYKDGDFKNMKEDLQLLGELVSGYEQVQADKPLKS